MAFWWCFCNLQRSGLDISRGEMETTEASNQLGENVFEYFREWETPSIFQLIKKWPQGGRHHNQLSGLGRALSQPRSRHWANGWHWQGTSPKQAPDREKLFISTRQKSLLPPRGTRWPGLKKSLSSPGGTSRKKVALVGVPVAPDKPS